MLVGDAGGCGVNRSKARAPSRTRCESGEIMAARSERGPGTRRAETDRVLAGYPHALPIGLRRILGARRTFVK